MKRPQRRLSKVELFLFKKYYPDMTRVELARKFGITEKAVENYGCRLHLYKSENYIVMIKRKGAEAAHRSRIRNNNRNEHNNV